MMLENRQKEKGSRHGAKELPKNIGDLDTM